MHKEVLKHPENSVAKNMIIIFGIVFSIMFFVGLSNAIQKAYNIPYIEYLIFILLVVFGVRFINKRMVEYRYTLIDDELIFETIIGKREKQILSVRLKDILSFGQATLVSAKNDTALKVKMAHRLAFKVNSSKSYYLIYQERDHTKKVIFEPSERLANAISRKIEEKRNQLK